MGGWDSLPFTFDQRLKHGAASIPRSGSSTKLRHSVAVLGFRNVSGSATEDWLSTAFTEMLNTELGANGDLLLVSGEDVVNAKHDLSLTLEDTLAKETLTRLRSSLGADVVVVGSYTLLKDGSKIEFASIYGLKTRPWAKPSRQMQLPVNKAICSISQLRLAAVCVKASIPR